MRIFKAKRNELETFQEMIKNDRQFTNYIDWRSGHVDGYSDDVTDIYNYIRNSNPVIESPEEKPLLQNFLNSNHEDFVDMRNRSRGNEILSYVATKSACKLYDKIIDGKLKEAAEKLKNKAQNELTDEEQKVLKRAKNSMNLEVRKGIKEPKDEFDEAEEALRLMACAGTETGCNPQPLNFKDSLEFLKKMGKNANVKQVMKLAGKFMNLAKHSLKTKTDGNESIVGIKLGNEISNLLPSELGMLVDEYFQALKELELIQRQLFQYKSKAKQPKTGGPIVLCVDESGSMTDCAQNGHRLIDNAKAFLFGMYEIAKAEKRPLVVVSFGDTNHTKTTEIKGVDDLIEVVSSFMCSNGTCFQSPLKEAKRVIENGGKFEKADIIFITDGCSRTNSSFVKDFNEFKKATQTKVVTLSLMSHFNGGGFTDKVVYGFDDLTELTY